MFWEEPKIWYDTLARWNRNCLLFSNTLFQLVCFYVLGMLSFPIFYFSIFVVNVFICMVIQEPSYISSCLYLSPSCIRNKASCRSYFARCCWFRCFVCNTDVQAQGLTLRLILSIWHWLKIILLRLNAGNQSCRCSESFPSSRWYAASGQLCHVIWILQASGIVPNPDFIYQMNWVSQTVWLYNLLIN